MTETPDISVLLPVYNGEHFLAESIGSILNQQFRNFELIILNDGSTDASENIIKSFNDPRIRYFKHTNRGLANTLNTGIKYCRASLIARQDQDDVSLPDRLLKQYNLFLNQKNLVLAGTWAEIIDSKGLPTGRFHKHPEKAASIRFQLIFNNPFVHSSVMFSKEAVINAGMYNEDPSVFEDFELWSRLARKELICNLPEVLVRYREVSTSISRVSQDYRQKVIRQCQRNLKYYLPGMEPEKLEAFAALCHGQWPSSAINENGFEETFDVLIKAFCKAENTAPESIAGEISQLRFEIKRHYYNGIIESEDSKTLKKLWARVKRRLLFLKYGNQT